MGPKLQMHTETTTTQASAGSVQRLVLPPPGMRCLDSLAWCIGRDDAMQGLLPGRCLNFRSDKARHYMDGYESQMRQKPQAERLAKNEETK